MKNEEVNVIGTKVVPNIDIANTDTIKDFSPRQKQRIDYLRGLAGDLAKDLVLNLDSRGRNSFQLVYDKLVAIINAKSDDQRYYDALYDNFDINTVYTVSEVIGITAEVRNDLGLPPYLSNPKSQCLNDFMHIFIVKDSTMQQEGPNGESKREFIGYIPVVRIINQRTSSVSPSSCMDGLFS